MSGGAELPTVSTILGFEYAGGVLLAGSRAASLGGVGLATGPSLVHELDGAGVAVVGDARAVDAIFHGVGRAGSAPTTTADGAGERPSVEAVAGLVADTLAPRSLTATALVAGHDADGRAGLRRVDADGRVQPVERVVLGTAADIVEAALDDLGENATADDAKTAARTAITAAVGSAADIDVVVVPHAD
jgi:20S proteasome alpha/beta subunit